MDFRSCILIISKAVANLKIWLLFLELKWSRWLDFEVLKHLKINVFLSSKNFYSSFIVDIFCNKNKVVAN